MMKISSLAVKAFLFSITLVFFGCTTARLVTVGEQIDLEYAGTIVFGPAQLKDGSYEVPLFFSGGKWDLNSAICFRDAEADVGEGRTIYIRIYTGLCSQDNPKPMLKLDDDLSGWYEVVFEDPDGQRHLLTVITL